MQKYLHYIQMAFFYILFDILYRFILTSRTKILFWTKYSLFFYHETPQLISKLANMYIHMLHDLKMITGWIEMYVFLFAKSKFPNRHKMGGICYKFFETPTYFPSFLSFFQQILITNIQFMRFGTAIFTSVSSQVVICRLVSDFTWRLLHKRHHKVHITYFQERSFKRRRRISQFLTRL